MVWGILFSRNLTLKGSALLQKLVRIPSLSAKLLLCVEKEYTDFFPTLHRQC